MKLLLVGTFVGSLVTFGVLWTWRDLVQVRLNDELRKDNEESREEIKRLRAQVALYINRDAEDRLYTRERG